MTHEIITNTQKECKDKSLGDRVLAIGGTLLLYGGMRYIDSKFDKHGDNGSDVSTLMDNISKLL